MKKIIKWSLIGFIGLVVIVAVAGGGGDKNSNVKKVSKEGQEETQETINIKQNESRLTTSENGRKIFNELGWNLYKAQFIKPEPEEDKDCFKDKTTCPYWEKLAKQHSVDVSDVKFVLYEASGVALNAKYQKIYDEYNKGLDVVFPKTEENGEKFEKEFAEKHGLKDYELKAITTKGLLYEPDKNEITVTDSEEAIAIADYSQEMVVISKRMSEALSRRGDIAKKWPHWNDDDVIEFAAAGIVLENLHSEVEKIIPPKSMVSVQEKILKGLDLYKQSVSIVNEGIDNADADLILQGTALMEEGTEWINKATKETEEVTEGLR